MPKSLAKVKQNLYHTSCQRLVVVSQPTTPLRVLTNPTLRARGQFEKGKQYATRNKTRHATCMAARTVAAISQSTVPWHVSCRDSARRHHMWPHKIYAPRERLADMLGRSPILGSLPLLRKESSKESSIMIEHAIRATRGGCAEAIEYSCIEALRPYRRDRVGGTTIFMLEAETKWHRSLIATAMLFCVEKAINEATEL
jgi:hypothetical protein